MEKGHVKWKIQTMIQNSIVRPANGMLFQREYAAMVTVNIGLTLDALMIAANYGRVTNDTDCW